MMQQKLVWTLLGAILMSNIGSCSASQVEEHVYFVFELKVGATTDSLSNVRYTFGTEIVDRVRPIARPGLSFEDFSAQMQIPERLDVSWETHDGKKHAVTVPVRGHLGGPITGKTLLFVLQEDSVEGYVTIYTPAGRKVERRFF
jgi:hypothetical protein